MTRNDTFFDTGSGAEHMMRHYGCAVLDAEDMGFQTLESDLEDGWYLWWLGEGPEGPYDTPQEAAEGAFDPSDSEFTGLMSAVTRTYNIDA